MLLNSKMVKKQKRDIQFGKTDDPPELQVVLNTALITSIFLIKKNIKL